MKKIKILILTIFCGTMLATAQIDNTTDEGVEINGVIWATRNVGEPGKFVDNPEDYGMFYQWNSKIGWSVTDPGNGVAIIGWNYRNDNVAQTWETNNNVCPVGWRVPTAAELASLGNGVRKNTAPYGHIFGSGSNTLFLPAAGGRNDSNGALFNSGAAGYYWSSTVSAVFSLSLPWYLYFESKGQDTGCTNESYGYSVRCVADENYIPSSVKNISETEKTILGFYNILGEKLDKEPASGIYIILYDNGKTEKRVK